MNMALLHCTQLYINRNNTKSTVYGSHLVIRTTNCILSLQSIQNTDFKTSSKPKCATWLPSFLLQAYKLVFHNNFQFLVHKCTD